MRVWLVLPLAGLFFAWMTASSQAVHAPDVTISVSDPAGVMVPGAEVLAVPVYSSGAAVMLHTDRSGVAYLNADRGTYELTVRVPGFETHKRTIEIVADHPNVEAVKLSIGFSPMPIRVADAPLVTLSPVAHEEGLLQEQTISPSRPIPAGMAPGMQVKLVSDKGGEKVYAVIFRKGDEVLSGLVDFAAQYKVQSAHFTGIGAVSGATVGWLDLEKKAYEPIEVREQVEVLSMMGDIALFNGKPVVHAHLVMGRRDGSTVGGHLWEAHVNPTLEVFVSVDARPLKKKQDEASGMKVIDPTQ